MIAFDCMRSANSGCPSGCLAARRQATGAQMPACTSLHGRHARSGQQAVTARRPAGGDRGVCVHAGGLFIDGLVTNDPLGQGQLLGDMLSRPDVALGIRIPWGLQLLGLVAVNVAVIAALQAAVRGANDSAPISVVKVQVGLLKDHNELQHKLGELSSMIRVGQQGIWLVLEETILELLRHRSVCSHAAVDVVRLNSKNEAYRLFSEMAERNLGVAKKEEEFATDVYTEADVAAAERNIIGESKGLSGMFGRLMGKPQRDEAMVITLLVACRGTLDVPQKMQSWQDVQRSLTQLCGVNRDKLMAIELLWTPHDEGYFLTREQMVQDYSELQQIR